MNGTTFQIAASAKSVVRNLHTLDFAIFFEHGAHLVKSDEAFGIVGNDYEFRAGGRNYLFQRIERETSFVERRTIPILRDS